MAKILVVDDVDTERMRSSGILRKAGHEIIEAKNGVEAIAMAKKNKPDAILMDIVMPEKDGFKATKELTRDEETKNIPVIMVSSKSQESDKVLAKKIGAKGYVIKPADPAELLKIIEGIL